MHNKLTKPPVSKRSVIRVRLTTLSGYDLAGSPANMIRQISSLEAQYPNQQLTINYEREQYGENYEFVVYGVRNETDDEWTARDAQEQERKRDRIEALEKALAHAKKELES
jgi:hypothetical protein